MAVGVGVGAVRAPFVDLAVAVVVEPVVADLFADRLSAGAHQAALFGGAVVVARALREQGDQAQPVGGCAGGLGGRVDLLVGQGLHKRSAQIDPHQVQRLGPPLAQRHGVVAQRDPGGAGQQQPLRLQTVQGALDQALLSQPGGRRLRRHPLHLREHLFVQRSAGQLQPRVVRAQYAPGGPHELAVELLAQLPAGRRAQAHQQQRRPASHLSCDTHQNDTPAPTSASPIISCCQAPSTRTGR